MSFSLAELRVLSGLAQQKTLASIGQDLYLGQPSISRILHAAEQKAGIQLVQRRGHRLSLTSAGLELAQMAQAIVAQLHEMDHLLQHMRTAQGGLIRLITTYLPGNYILPAAIGEFWQYAPHVRVALEVLPVGQIADAFVHQAYDLGIGPPVVRARGLSIEPLYDDPVLFFVAPESPLARRRGLRWADLQQETLIGSFSDSYWVPLFEELGRRGLRMERQLDLRAHEGVKRLVRSGGGIGVTVASSIQEELDRGQVRALALAEPTLAAPFCLIRRSNTVPTPIARQFRSFLLHRFGHEHALGECLQCQNGNCPDTPALVHWRH